MLSRKSVLISLIIAALALKLFSLNPSWVEQYYSNGLYPSISAVQRLLFGWLPFSIGDLLYAALIIRLVYAISIAVKNRQFNFRRTMRQLLMVSLVVYVSFNFLWGLNYNRLGIAHQLKLDKFNYTDTDLVQLTQTLAIKLNSLRISDGRLAKKKYLFSKAVSSYHRSVLAYQHPSVKPSLYSYAGNYLGFTGYYNPFTGEAQVNTTVPLFIQPFTTCHEIGHQLGYAKESEANFAGFLAASASTDTAFLYSVYFDMYAYASRYLYSADSISLKHISNTLSPAVKRDIGTLREFYRKHYTPIETAIDHLYAQYLKANEQPSGKMSYNEVIGLLIAYYKKNDLL